MVLPPARFNLLDAECGSPDAAKGCADVCAMKNRVLYK
jgi:hypothetical protein